MSDAAQLPRWLATPDGRVALLFTDIVGSTERLAEIGEERWLEALRAHNVLVREEVHAHDGTEVKFTGDGWMVAFADPRQAVRCATAIQRSLADSEGFAVRAGVHLGPAVKEGADFLGKAVVVASRVADAARPGEVLVSWTIRCACGGEGFRFAGAREIEIRGLGPHCAFPVSWQGEPQPADLRR